VAQAEEAVRIILESRKLAAEDVKAWRANA
jgi:hypothetical protein